jgi:hypothetical protein
MRVTFDTNTLDKVARPSRFTKDTGYSDMLEIHEALKRGDIEGFVCDTAITLEGITRDNRASVFGGTTTRRSTTRSAEGTFTITISTEQLDRPPLHPEQTERFMEAFRLGIRLLRATRIAMPAVEEQFYAVEEPAHIGERHNRFVDLAREIENRDLGCRRAEALATRLSGNEPSFEPWFNGLGNVRDVHERGEVARAVAEWADGDSVAAHYGYGNDYYCTHDKGKAENRRGNPSIFDEINRAWLTAQFGVQFAAISDLAAKLRD